MRSYAATTIAALVTSSAFAQMTLTEDRRSLLAFVSAVNADGTQTDSDEAENTTFGGAWNESVSASVLQIGAVGSASAGQISSFSPFEIRAQSTASVSATVDAEAGGLRAGGFATSILTMEFTVLDGTPFTLQSATSGLTSFRFENAPGDALFEGSGFFQTTLSAGLYRIEAIINANFVAVAPTLPNGSAGGGYSFVARAVPTPAGVLALVPLVLMRRRMR